MAVPRINSSHGAETRNIINVAIDLINAQGKAIQDLVAEGQLTEGQYAQLITVVNGLIKSGEVDKFDLNPNLRHAVDEIKNKIDRGNVTLNDLHPNVLNEISDSGTIEVLSIPRDGSVSPKKTTFIDVSSNLLDINRMEDGYIIDENTGENSPLTRFSASALIKVDPLTTYSFNRVTYFARYDINADFLGGTYLNLEGAEATTTPNTEYIKVSVEITNKDEAQINEGDELLPYEPYYRRLNEDISRGFDPKLNQLIAALASENESWEDN